MICLIIASLGMRALGVSTMAFVVRRPIVSDGGDSIGNGIGPMDPVIWPSTIIVDAS
jgi:hypothetical protein